MQKMYFVGVSTAASSIHSIFPDWVLLAGVPDSVVVGVDIALNSPPDSYRAVIRQILHDTEARGALVTTHKVHIYTHARDLFTDFNADAEKLEEISCIVRRENRFSGLAIDTLTSGLALSAILDTEPFRGHALILGAGGAGLALAVHLLREHQPARVVLTDLSSARVDQVRQKVTAECVLVSGPAGNDRLLESLPSGSLIVNATGMGKDRPGSPITPEARFPAGSAAWDFNYRGELLFLEYARAQRVRAFDGWEYFLHGWSQIMARVLGFELTPALFTSMRQTAAPLR